MEQVFGCWGALRGESGGRSLSTSTGRSFEDADQCTVVLGMQTEHGRSTPLVWRPSRARSSRISATTMKTNLLVVFASVVPKNVRSWWLADRASPTASSIAS